MKTLREMMDLIESAQTVAEMDKSQTPPSRHGDYPLGAKGTTAKPVTAKKVVKDLAMDFDQAFAKQKPVKKKGVKEGKITLSTDPNWYGAEVGDYKATGPIVNLSASQLVGFEPDNKMDQPASKANVEKIVAGLKQGDKLPPLLVRKYKNGYQVLDGHHRFLAYKLLGTKSIPAQVVPDEDIEEKGQQGVAEGHADQQRKIFKKNGEPVGEVGIDRESSPGVGQWYMKCYAYNIDNAGYESYEEAVAELKHCLKQGVTEEQIEETELDPVRRIEELFRNK